MRTKLFFMFVLAIAILTSCEKVVGTYSFSNGVTITKYKKGDKIRYESTYGYVVKSSGDIVVVQKLNHSSNFGDARDKAEYFSAVYNINQRDPIMSFDEYYVVVRLYPKGGFIVASRAAKNSASPIYTLRTFDGKRFMFPRKLFSGMTYETGTVADIVINEDTQCIKLIGSSVSIETICLKDIRPDQIHGNEIRLDY